MSLFGMDAIRGRCLLRPALSEPDESLQLIAHTPTLTSARNCEAERKAIYISAPRVSLSLYLSPSSFILSLRREESKIKSNQRSDFVTGEVLRLLLDLSSLSAKRGNTRR